MFNCSEKETNVLPIVGTVIYACGFLGNCLCLTIFLPSGIRRVSTGLLFFCLTISNNFHLLTLFIEFLDATHQIRLFHSIFVRCRLIYYFQNIFRSFSSFIACTISLDRMFRAIHPARAKQFCTCRMVRRIVWIYFLIFACAYTFYLLPLMRENDQGRCSPQSHSTYAKFINTIWPPIRAVLICFLPASIMIIANILLWKEIRASKRRVAPVTTHSSSTDTMLIFLTISNVVVFLLTQIPFHLYSIIVGYYQSIDYVRMPILVWSSVYFGIGFYIYCLTSPYFRTKFLSAMSCYFNRNARMNIRRNTISNRIF